MPRALDAELISGMLFSCLMLFAIIGAILYGVAKHFILKYRCSGKGGKREASISHTERYLRTRQAHKLRCVQRARKTPGQSEAESNISASGSLVIDEQHALNTRLLELRHDIPNDFFSRLDLGIKTRGPQKL